MGKQQAEARFFRPWLSGLGYNSLMRRTVFFIPSYFDSNSFLRLRREILLQWNLSHRPEFYLLDDSSGRDPGITKAAALADTKVRSYGERLGHQKILVNALRDFCFENHDVAQDQNVLIVTMDGDGEDKSQDALRLQLEWLDQREKDPMILAKRRPKERPTLYGTAREAYRGIFYFLTGLHWETGNFAFFSLGSARKIIFHKDFDYSYASSLVKHANHIVLLACERGNRWEGKTRMGLAAWLLHGYALLLPYRSRIWERFGERFSLIK